MPPNSPSDDRPMSFLNSSQLPAAHIITLSFPSPLINLKNYGPLLTLSFHVKLLLHFLPLLLLLFLPLPFSTSSVTRLQNSALPLILFLLLLHLLIFLLLHLLLPSPHSGSALSLINSYLSNRYHHVAINDSSSVPLHVTTFPSLCPFQSAYRKFHSTETALLSIYNDPQGSVLGSLLSY